MQLTGSSFFRLSLRWHGKELVRTPLPRRQAILRDLGCDIGQLLMVCTSLIFVRNLPRLFVLCHFGVLLG